LNGSNTAHSVQIELSKGELPKQDGDISTYETVFLDAFSEKHPNDKPC